MGVREGKGETRGLTETEGCIIYLVMEQETQDSFNFRDERTDAVRAPPPPPTHTVWELSSGPTTCAKGPHSHVNSGGRSARRCHTG